MRHRIQETREAKLLRKIGNLARALEYEPSLKSIRQRKSELESQLQNMPLNRRQEVIPPKEIERERKETIANCDYLIAAFQKDLKEKREQQRKDLQNLKGCIRDLRKQRARTLRKASHT